MRMSTGYEGNMQNYSRSHGSFMGALAWVISVLFLVDKQ